MSEPYSPKPVTITLTPDEALVLFDYLSRCQQKGNDFSGPVDEPERIALWNLLALLEGVLVEPFLGDYGDRVERARASLRG
jgi:hypothetical protein